MSNSEEKKMQAEQRANDAFGKFLNAPTTKFMLSLIPPTDDKAPPETLETLLQQAFAAGRIWGSSEILGTILEVMVKPKEQK